jgi:Polyketide cyclase / dehydrase and lipid transport
MSFGAVQFRAVSFRTESRITIASEVSEVWAYLCDVARWPEWAPTVVESRINGGTPLQPGAQVDQRAKGPFGTSRRRSQKVVTVEPPSRMAFAGPLGTSFARWGMELEPMADGRTDAMMWIEVELRNVMRAIPREPFKSRIQRVSDIEMIAIKAAVEATTQARTS